MMRGGLPKLPPEIISEILIRLPLKPIVKSQLVCKEWQAIILNYRFMKNHMERSPCIHDITFPTVITELFYPERVFDGLILMCSSILWKHILWNPAAGLVLELPEPHDGSYSYGRYLSVVPATRCYKVVSFCKDLETALLGCRVITLDDALEWRELTIPFPYTVDADACVLVLSVPSAVHCVVRVKYDEEFTVKIITLDVETESFTLTPFPTGIFCDLQRVSVLLWNGKLALYEMRGYNMEVLVLEDYKKQQWCREKEVIPLSFLQDEWFKGKPLRPLSGKDGEICFEFVFDQRMFTYVIKTGKTRVDNFMNEWPCFAYVRRLYKPSFVTFKGMRPDEELQGFRFHMVLD